MSVYRQDVNSIHFVSDPEKLAGGPVLLDGAWGTELQARGLPPGEVGDLWNLERPERVEAVARAYVEAGSRIILTNTFRANRIALGPAGAARTVEVNRAGAEISRRAAEGSARVFGSIGPSGKLLVTGHDENGKGGVLFDGPAPNVRQRSSGVVSTLLWRNDTVPADISGGQDRALGCLGETPGTPGGAGPRVWQPGFDNSVPSGFVGGV